MNAEAAFNALDKRLEQKKKLLADAIANKRDTKALEASVAETKRLWSLARDRFELQIEERKTLVQIATLENKLKRNREAKARLDGTAAPPAKDDESTKSAQGVQPRVPWRRAVWPHRQARANHPQSSRRHNRTHRHRAGETDSAGQS